MSGDENLLDDEHWDDRRDAMSWFFESMFDNPYSPSQAACVWPPAVEMANRVLDGHRHRLGVIRIPSPPLALWERVERWQQAARREYALLQNHIESTLISYDAHTATWGDEEIDQCWRIKGDWECGRRSESPTGLCPQCIEEMRKEATQ